MRDKWNRPDEEEAYFTEETLKRLSRKVARWVETPTYVQVSESESEALSARIDLKNSHPKARELVGEVFGRVKNCTEAKDYRLGLEIVRQALDSQVEKLPIDEQDAARRKLFYKKGFLHEAIGTWEMENLPLSDPKRKAQFFQAIESYIDADLQVEGGLVSDYALRVSEAAGGAELSDLQVKALTKAFGEGNFVLADKGDAGIGIMMQDVMRRSGDAVSLGRVPGGKEVIKYSDIHLPGEHSN